MGLNYSCFELVWCHWLWQRIDNSHISAPWQFVGTAMRNAKRQGFAARFQFSGRSHAGRKVEYMTDLKWFIARLVLNALSIFAVMSEFRLYLKTKKAVWDLHLLGYWLTFHINHTAFLPSPERFLQVGLQLLLISQKVLRIAVHFGFGLPRSPQWIDSWRWKHFMDRWLKKCFLFRMSLK